MKKVICLAVLVSLTGCVTSNDEVNSTLVKAGFTSIKVGGVSMMSCSEDDKVGRSFTATNPAGVEVGGVVCCGVLKGCTIRF